MPERVDLLLQKEQWLEDLFFPRDKKNLPLMDTQIIDDAIKTWGYEKQFTQLAEECGEAVVEIMHTFFRPDRDTPLDKLLEEIVGVRIAVDHVIRLHQQRCEEIYLDQIAKEIRNMGITNEKIKGNINA